LLWLFLKQCRPIHGQRQRLGPLFCGQGDDHELWTQWKHCAQSRFATLAIVHMFS
jgi:hypothetical protein